MREYETPAGVKKSVTSFLRSTWHKAWLAPWYGKVGIKKAQKASMKGSKRGTAVHFLIRSTIERPDNTFDRSEYSKDVIGFYDSWKKLWYEVTVVKANVIKAWTELQVWSKLGYAGTLDLLTEDADGWWTVWDWKAAKHLDLEYLVQLSAYVKAAIERGLIPRRKKKVRIKLIRLDPSGQYPLEICTVLYDDWNFIFNVGFLPLIAQDALRRNWKIHTVEGRMRLADRAFAKKQKEIKAHAKQTAKARKSVARTSKDRQSS